MNCRGARTIVAAALALAAAARPTGAQDARAGAAGTTPGRREVESVIVPLSSAPRTFTRVNELAALGARIGGTTEEIAREVEKARRDFAAAPSPSTEAALLGTMANGLTRVVGDYLEVGEKTQPAIDEVEATRADLRKLRENLSEALGADEGQAAAGKARRAQVEEALARIAERLRALGYDTANAAAVPREILDAASSLRATLGELEGEEIGSASYRRVLEKQLSNLERADAHFVRSLDRLAELKKRSLGLARRLGAQARHLEGFCKSRSAVHQARRNLEQLQLAVTQLSELEKGHGIDFTLPDVGGDTIEGPPANESPAELVGWILQGRPESSRPSTAAQVATPAAEKKGR